MTSAKTRLTSTVTKFARWYRTPGGLISLVFIACTVGLVVADAVRWALLVAVVWVATIFPHKLMRERRDWENALHRTEHHTDERVEAIRREYASVAADISQIPTAEEVQSWQTSIEESQRQTNGDIAADIAELERQRLALDELAHRIDSDLAVLRGEVDEGSSSHDAALAAIQSSLDTAVSSVRESLAKLDTDLANVRDSVPKTMVDPQLISREVQAVNSLHLSLQPEMQLPPLGDWALSTEAASMLARLIVDEGPNLIVETGSGSSTVIAALAAQLNGSGHVIALEHDLGYARATRQLLHDRGLDKFATVVDAPLTTFRIGGDDYLWYDIPDGEITQPIDVLLVDGPPGTTGPQARFPALPLLIDHLSPGAYVLVDDAARVDETQMSAKWQEDFELYHVERSRGGDLAILRRV